MCGIGGILRRSHVGPVERERLGQLAEQEDRTLLRHPDRDADLGGEDLEERGGRRDPEQDEGDQDLESQASQHHPPGKGPTMGGDHPCETAQDPEAQHDSKQVQRFHPSGGCLGDRDHGEGRDEIKNGDHVSR